MNDITALMAIMKAAALRAAAAISDYDRGRIDVLEKRLAVEEYEKLVSEPANVLVLVEALEHYKSREERVTKLVLDNSVSWEELFKQLEEAKQRIAELESRTVIVKLAEDKPAESESEVDDAEAWFDEGWNARGEADRDALVAAGIQVIEGEGQ